MNVRVILGAGLVVVLLVGVAVGAMSLARAQKPSYSSATPAPIGRASPPPPPPTMPPTAPPTDTPQVSVAAAGGGIAQSPVPTATHTPEPTGVVTDAGGGLVTERQQSAPTATPQPTGAVAAAGGGMTTGEQATAQPSASPVPTTDPARDGAAPFALSIATNAQAQSASTTTAADQTATGSPGRGRSSASFIDGLPPIVWAVLAAALLAVVGVGMVLRRRKRGRGTPQALAPLGGLDAGRALAPTMELAPAVAAPPAPTPAATAPAPPSRRRSPPAFLSGLRLSLPKRAGAPVGKRARSAATGTLAPVAPEGNGATIAFDLGRSDMCGLLDDDATAAPTGADSVPAGVSFDSISAQPASGGDFSFDAPTTDGPERVLTPTTAHDADAAAFDWADTPLAPSLPASANASNALAPQPDVSASGIEGESGMLTGDTVFAFDTPGLAAVPAAAPAAGTAPSPAPSTATPTPDSPLALGPALPPAAAPSALPPPAALDRQSVLKYVKKA